ncbi:MAG: hypothetical protein WCL17_04685 [Actinomycetota bacterium]|jgi:hypothetical protein
MYRSKSVATALASVVLGGAALALAGFALASNTPHQKSLQCVTDATKANTCNLSFSSFPDSLAGQHGANGGSHPDWVSYSNQALEVPANTTVNVTIKQYDSGEALNNNFFAQVMGTVGGTATVNGVTVTHVDPTKIGHTFTLRGIPGSGSDIFVNVPLPADELGGKVVIGDGEYTQPNVIKFSFKTGSKGVYEWNCEYPCGGSRQGGFGQAMSSFGYMSGTLTVK